MAYPVCLRALLLATLFACSSFAGCIFAEEETKSSEDVEAKFTYSPKSNNKVGDTISFDASTSIPDDGLLDHYWDFNGDGTWDCNKCETAEHSFSESGTYTVILSVIHTKSDVEDESSQTITILAADTVIPVSDPGSATIKVINPGTSQEESDETDTDCDDNDATTGTFYLVYICETLESNDRSVNPTVMVELDGSDSTSGGQSAVLTEWVWDLNVDVDSDGDDVTDNDEDATGETYEWKDVQPGEYEVQLTVTNSKGAEKSKTVKVYVNYLGTWNDLEIAGKPPGGERAEIEFTFSVEYDSDTGNTIRRATLELTYPKQDDDWVIGSGSEQNRNNLSIYSYNETDDEVKNTSGYAENQKTWGDCNEEDNDCDGMQLTSGEINSYEPGQWMGMIVNERANDVNNIQFRILLVYK